MRITSVAKRLEELAEILAKMDEGLFCALAENGCDVVMPQQLREMAGRLQALDDRSNGYSSRRVAAYENPGKSLWSIDGKTFVP